MDTFRDFHGNAAVVQTLKQMIAGERIPQTILLSGPEGVGKATLARRFAAALLGGSAKVERDDLSLPHNQEILAERDKWAADKRADDPLLFSTHPDFITFPVDGPLFVGLLIGVILLVGALTFFPALSLGPIAEHFEMLQGHWFK